MKTKAYQEARYFSTTQQHIPTKQNKHTGIKKQKKNKGPPEKRKVIK